MKSETCVQKPTWWEKTVEWQFVLSASNQRDLKFAPLSGDPESAEGDSKISSEKKFALIEFKRESGDCHAFSEYKKYARDIEKPSGLQAKDKFDNACKELVQLDGHKSHLFIYGTSLTTDEIIDQLFGIDPKTPQKPDAGQLILEASSYWTHKALAESALMAVKKCLADKPEYDVYVKRLAELRGYTQSTQSGGSVVLGFDENCVTVMDIMEYFRTINLAPSANPVVKKDDVSNRRPSGLGGSSRK